MIICGEIKMEIRPSQLKNWGDIDQSKANTQCTGGKPEIYGWFEIDGVFHAHRKPSMSEWDKNEFN